MAILRVKVTVVVFVHINHHNDIVALQLLGDIFVRLVEVVELVTPTAPVGAKLQEDVFIVRLSDDQRISDLLGSIG